MACHVQGIAFITGGASGIGNSTAIALARNGINGLALLDLNLSLLEDVRCHIRSEYPNVDVEIFQVNVADEVSVETAVNATVKKFGRIDIGINCAGISGNPSSTHQMSLEEWRKVIDVNQTGLWLCQRAIIRQMLTQESRGIRDGRGVIVNVSSMFGVGGPPGPFGIPHYTAAKHAVVGLTKMDAKAYARDGIRINAVCPGFVDTPIIKEQIESGTMEAQFQMTPVGRPAQVEEISDVMFFLCSTSSSYMCGAALVVDGGFTV